MSRCPLDDANSIALRLLTYDRADRHSLSIVIPMRYDGADAPSLRLTLIEQVVQPAGIGLTRHCGAIVAAVIPLLRMNINKATELHFKGFQCF